MNWADDQIKFLKEAWADPDMTSGSIAKHMRLSRNSVIGKALRLKLGHKAGRGTGKYTPRVDRRNSVFLLALGRPKTFQPLPPKKATTIKPLLVPLVDLQNEQCHWPCSENKKGKILFCGLPRERDSYCATHWRIGHVI